MKNSILSAVLVGLMAVPATAATPKKVIKQTVIEQVVTNDKIVEGAGTDEARLVDACSARKFETSAVLERDGQKRVTKLKLCSNPGADDMAWLKTLQSARSRVAGIPNLSLDSRVKIEAELDAEIARLQGTMAH